MAGFLLGLRAPQLPDQLGELDERLLWDLRVEGLDQALCGRGSQGAHHLFSTEIPGQIAAVEVFDVPIHHGFGELLASAVVRHWYQQERRVLCADLAGTCGGSFALLALVVHLLDQPGHHPLDDLAAGIAYELLQCVLKLGDPIDIPAFHLDQRERGVRAQRYTVLIRHHDRYHFARALDRAFPRVDVLLGDLAAAKLGQHAQGQQCDGRSSRYSNPQSEHGA